MAKEYTPPKTINGLSLWLARRGLGRGAQLTTIGHRSGEPRHIPVSPITVGGVEYLVAPYGEVAWVRNVRANPDVTIRRGRSITRARLTDVTLQAPEVVKAYYDRERFPRPYMDVPAEPTVEDFSGLAGHFPVFRIEQAG